MFEKPSFVVANDVDDLVPVFILQKAISIPKCRSSSLGMGVRYKTANGSFQLSCKCLSWDCFIVSSFLKEINLF